MPHTAGLNIFRSGTDAELDPYAERILDAARRQLVDFGLRRTSLDDIARAAQVGVATLYRRFPNRDALLTALAAREARACVDAVEEQIAGIDDAQDQVVAAVLAAIHELTTNTLLQRLLVTDADRLLPLLTLRGAPILALGRDYVAGELRRLRAAGATVTGDPDVVAELLARLVLSLVLTRESVLPLDDHDRLERAVRTSVAPLILGSRRQRSPYDNR